MQYYDINSQVPMMPPCIAQCNYMRVPETIPPYQLPMQHTIDTVSLLPYTYPQNLTQALQLIIEGVAGESEDRKFYEYLIRTAPAEEYKEIIKFF